MQTFHRMFGALCLSTEKLDPPVQKPVLNDSILKKKKTNNTVINSRECPPATPII